MKDQHIIDLLPEYLDGTLSSVEKQAVKTHIQDCASCQTGYEETKQIFQAFEIEKSLQLSAVVRNNFFAQIETEKVKSGAEISLNTNSKNYWSLALKVAAGIALLFGAFQLGNYQKQIKIDQKIALIEAEQNEFKQMAMLSLMENQSASKRILGVNYIDEINKPDDAIVLALTERMLHDENINVRLTAVEALGRFSSSKSVKDAFITALGTEEDPAIQITIIHILVKIQEKEVVNPMRKLLKKEETQPFVKQEIESLLPNII